MEEKNELNEKPDKDTDGTDCISNFFDCEAVFPGQLS